MMKEEIRERRNSWRRDKKLFEIIPIVETFPRSKN